MAKYRITHQRVVVTYYDGCTHKTKNTPVDEYTDDLDSYKNNLRNGLRQLNNLDLDTKIDIFLEYEEVE